MTTRGKWLDVYFHKNKTPMLKPSPVDNNVSRCFQVCVNVIEGKKLTFAYPSQATSYVTVALDDVKYRSSVRKNMRVPYYRENFAFELTTNTTEMTRKCLWFSVMEPCCSAPRLLGEAGVDLAHVWRQPHHTITHKWVQLTLPTDAKGDSVGYLKVDISISIRTEELIALHCQEKIEECNYIFNNLLPCGSEQQPACYQITIYRAYNVPCNTSIRPDFLGNPPTTCLRVSFCDLLAETSPQQRTNNPVYIERVLMVERFPNVCDAIELEVWSMNGGTKVLASTRLNMSEISHGGENGFLPTFGPSLLHMYQPWRRGSAEDGPFHRGALLVAMKTVVPDYRRCLRTVLVEPVNPRLLDTEWIVDNFVVFCPIFEVSMLDKSMSGASCGVAITACEISFGSCFDEGPEFERLMLEIKQKKLHFSGNRLIQPYSSELGNLQLAQCPVLQLAARLPDFRFRMYMDNVLLDIITNLEDKLADISDSFTKKDYQGPNGLLEQLCRTNDDAAAKIKKFLDVVQYSSSNEDMQKYTTELDHKLIQLQKEKIEKIYYLLISRKTKSRHSPCKCLSFDKCDSKKNFKLMLAESKCVLQELKELVYKTPDGWPHISVWLLSNGSRVAYAKMAPSDILHSVTPEQSGRLCGKIQTVYLKPIKCPRHDPSDCHCISGKVELLAWMGSFRQCAAFQVNIPDGYRRSEADVCIECDPMCLECCVNIYRAKLTGASDIAGLSPFVRIHFINNVKDTQVCQNCPFPVWNEVLRISCTAYVTLQRLKFSPPEILLEVYHRDVTQKDKIDLLGRVAVTPVLSFAQDLEPPMLEWFDIQLGTENVGRILMSAQLMQINGSGLNNAIINRSQELQQTATNAAVRTVLATDVPEPLPLHILPANKSYKMDVYFWGLREVGVSKPLVTLELEDMTIKSAIITQCKCNGNFPNGRISQTFQGDLDNESSKLCIKLYDTTTFGRTLFVGSNVKKPQKYLFTWISKIERDEKLSSRPVVNNMFMQVNRKTFVKRNSTYPVFVNPKTCEDEEEDNSKLRWEKMKNMFYCKKTKEEEMMLLPIHPRDREGVVKEAEDDWWARYYHSLNEKSSGDRELAGNRITLYDSELERQPEFSRFKDWSRTIKIYNGCKTGIPEQDEKLRCGCLRANIAIYEWPAPPGTVAVCNCGDDLERGYFVSYPDNYPSRYLVRVYAVKCSGLEAKGFTTTSRCYVMVQCRSKCLCDRESCVPQDAEPLIGKMYELACTLPEDYLLKVSVMACGSTRDELIGSTSIDLDDRAYTKHRATVGLSAEYNMNGPNRWRDSERPSAILEQLCERNHLPAPVYPDPSTLVVNGVEYKDLESGSKYTSPLLSKENLCLSILHKWHTMPVCGHRLVPEHVEVRSLYDPDKPNVEQGKIHMWVDMFPLDNRRIPAPVSISARPDKYYELRVTVCDVRGVKLTRGASIYVRAWVGTCDEAQDTDIYVTKNGEAHFNWRMIFQFQYKPTEKKLVFHDPVKEGTDTFPPILVVQLLDMDAPTLHDFLGILTLDLTCMPRGARLPQSAPAVKLSGMRRINLFELRSARGWWPLRMLDRDTGRKYFTGMVELEISLWPLDKALLMPVGIGRDSPVPLADPLRQRVTSNTCDCAWLSCNFVTWLSVVVGLLLLGVYLYWQLPVIIFSVLPSMSM